MADIPTTSTTLLRDLANDSQHVRWGEFVARYRPMMEAFMRERFPSLDAALSGPSNAVVRLKNCLLNNMTMIQHPKNRISYVMEGGAYLNFVNLDETSQMRKSVRLAEECKGGNDYAVEFRGPLTFKDLNRKRQEERDRTLREETDRVNRDGLKAFPERQKSWLRKDCAETAIGSR